MAAERFDVIVIGGGPNGLTCAAYLARAGASVMVLDKRFEWGGTMFTDDYSTPFQYNICQFALPFTASLPPYADLELERLGVRLLEPEVAAAFVPEGQGQPLIVRRDGTGLDQLRELLEAAQQVVPPLLFAPPAPVDQIDQVLDHGDGKLLLELAHFTPHGLVETLQDERAAGLVRYLCALAGFGAADQPLGVIGAFALSRLLHPTLVMGGSKSLPIGLFRAGAGAGAQYRTVADVGLIEPGVSGGFGSRARTGASSPHGRSSPPSIPRRPSLSWSIAAPSQTASGKGPKAGSSTPPARSPRTLGSRASRRSSRARTQAWRCCRLSDSRTPPRSASNWTRWAAGASPKPPPATSR
jgi:phytoene dehydrogenase-like protein